MEDFGTLYLYLIILMNRCVQGYTSLWLYSSLYVLSVSFYIQLYII